MPKIGSRAAAMAGALALLAACAEMPVGPTTAVMPAANKPFDVFMRDDEMCRGWAAHSIGQPGHEAAAEAFLRSTVAGAVIGAIAGGLAGGDRGAGTGAAMGTAVGAAAGAGHSQATAWSAQRRYDVAYQQCMYAKGNVVPGYAAPVAVPVPPPPAPR